MHNHIQVSQQNTSHYSPKNNIVKESQEPGKEAPEVNKNLDNEKADNTEKN